MRLKHVQSSIAVVIPTYQREGVLLNTLEILLGQSVGPAEILVVDQTREHEEVTQIRLSQLEQKGQIKWIRLSEPSIPKAMNVGLRAAKQPIVLYLDDDIDAGSELIAAHLEAHEKYPGATAIVGQVLQPGQTPTVAELRCRRAGLTADLQFPFYSSEGAWVSNVMAGNLSVKREAALAIGGFDENFSGVAYRFETDFARRLISAGGKIRFFPGASIHHLQVQSGGTRSGGSHLTSASPRHGMGDYYFAFVHGKGPERWSYSLSRLLREVRTKFHLRHPWWIPVKLLGEIRALLAGYALAQKKLKQSAIEPGHRVECR